MGCGVFGGFCSGGWSRSGWCVCGGGDGCGCCGVHPRGCWCARGGGHAWVASGFGIWAEHRGVWARGGASVHLRRRFRGGSRWGRPFVRRVSGIRRGRARTLGAGPARPRCRRPARPPPQSHGSVSGHWVLPPPGEWGPLPGHASPGACARRRAMTTVDGGVRGHPTCRRCWVAGVPPAGANSGQADRQPAPAGRPCSTGGPG